MVLGLPLAVVALVGVSPAGDALGVSPAFIPVALLPVVALRLGKDRKSGVFARLS